MLRPSSQFLKVLGPLILIVWSVWYLDFSHQKVKEFARKFRNERKLFVADFLQHEIDGKFNGDAINQLCASRKWTSGLVMTCDGVYGGVAFVRNAYLHCIRFAIQAGGKNPLFQEEDCQPNVLIAELVLPVITPRSDDDLKSVTGREGLPLDYLFDSQHLHDVLGGYCPQMKVHESLDVFFDVPQIASPIEFNIGDINGGDWVNGSVLAKPENWTKQFEDFLETKSPRRERKYPLRVHLKHTTWTWPTAFDKSAFTSSFGRILRIRTDARALAASALFNLAVQFDLKLDPRTRYHPESFVGIHLRTEEDVNEKYPDYVTQVANYMQYLSDSQSSVAFLATGANEENITTFAERAEDFNITVVTKSDILSDEDLKALDRLTWDQRALVDYEIMLRAGQMASVGASSFAWNLAMRRSYAFGSGPQTVWSDPVDTIPWKDPYTTLFGKNEQAAALKATIWP